MDLDSELDDDQSLARYSLSQDRITTVYGSPLFEADQPIAWLVT